MLDWVIGMRLTPSNSLLRTLLIHEFRRVQLRDPQLPDTLLATNWPGHAARYANGSDEIAPGSEGLFCRTLQTKDGPPPPLTIACCSASRSFRDMRLWLGSANGGRWCPRRNRTTT